MKITGISGSALSFYLSELFEEGGRLLVVAPFEEAPLIYRELKTFTDPLFFPAWDVEPESGLSPSVSVVADRVRTLVELVNRSKYLVVTTPYALAQKASDPMDVLEKLQVVVKGANLVRDEFVRTLVDMGYTRVSVVENVGGFSVRGDVIDVFPLGERTPYRIELFGDEVESIRSFDPVTQRSLQEKGSITVLPFKEPDAVRDALEVLQADRVVFVDPDTVRAQFEDAAFWGDGEVKALSPHVEIFPFEEAKSGIQTHFLLDASLKGEKRISYVASRVRELLKEGFKGFVVVEGRDRQKAIYELFLNYGLTARPTEYRRSLVRTGLYVIPGFLREGFLWEEYGVFFITEKELFGKRKAKRKKVRAKGSLLTSLRNLSHGDYVIHRDHGIGVFRGLKKTEASGMVKEFLTIEYKDGDVLYVPVDKLNLVQKYVGAEGSPPRIDKLGGTTWKRAKEKVKKGLEKFVKELLELQAKRLSAKGFAFSPDTPWQREFEESFPYEETPDQMKAVEDVKADMESEKPMERLICGDVGFGKTEVAMRAAFKAVVDGKQVAVLVPTTVLAEQHYETFSERFKDYPVNIEVLSRFKSRKEQKRILEALKKGDVDIVIGTHRLLSDDVVFKDLGLVIIDEEHKFGVKHKEKFKALKANVDVLLLSATPIPRTLNLALSGLKDISVIETPPEGRKTVKTFVTTFRKETLRRAISRELSRGGSVFIVQNRIEGLEELAGTVRSMFPQAKIDIAHGRMKSSELEKIMYRFFKGETSILISTAIVESGLDIPNANTLIVVGAEKFGLAQLYQLRGRVGRGKETAYAYFLVTPGSLTEEAKKRLKALQEFSELGSGLRLALRDMEIRGFGSILGKEQSGNIASIGLEEYLNLLEETVNRMKGEEKVREIEPQIVVAVEAYIPDSYIEDDNVKLAVYKRIMSADIDELDEVREEVRDRFGQLPDEVEGLFTLSALKILCKRLFVEKLQQKGKTFSLEFSPYASDAVLKKVEASEGFVRKGERSFIFLSDGVKPLIESLLKLISDVNLQKTRVGEGK